MNEHKRENPQRTSAQFLRVGEQDRVAINFFLNGERVTALAGDTVLTAVLTLVRSVRRNEFSGQPRAGFCVMGACQDCWIQTEEGTTIRACSTAITEGMRLLSLTTRSEPNEA